MKIKGIDKEELNELATWYAYHNNVIKVNTHDNISGVSVSRKPVVNFYTRMLGYLHFEKMLRSCHEFSDSITLKPYNYNNDSLKIYKCKDKEGNNVVIDFFLGDAIDFPPTIKVLDGSNADILCYYFKDLKKYTRQMTEEETELFNKIMNEKELKMNK